MATLSTSQEILEAISSLSDIRQQARILKTNMAVLCLAPAEDLKSSGVLEVLLKVASAERVALMSAVRYLYPSLLITRARCLVPNLFAQMDDMVAAHSAVLDFLCKRLTDMTDATTLLNNAMPALLRQSLKALALSGLPRAQRWAIRCQQVRIHQGLVIMLGFQNTWYVTNLRSSINTYHKFSLSTHSGEEVLNFIHDVHFDQAARAARDPSSETVTFQSCGYLYNMFHRHGNAAMRDAAFLRSIAKSGGQAIVAHFCELFSDDSFSQPDMVIAHGVMMQGACSNTELASLLHQRGVHAILARRVWMLLRAEGLATSRASLQARSFLQVIGR